MNEPTIIFSSFEDAEKCLKFYQNILGLDNWIINLKFKDELNEHNADGCVTYGWATHDAIIDVLCEFDNIKHERASKFCQECIIIHELLHLKFGIMPENDSFESVYAKEYYHEIIESMSKAILMAKYNITLDWFKTT